ncbi:37449_t:CDS:2 [Gigaspora margarita]|uniref:37449_t:CDS:1 n=1 Tax=Gigaspora margarita TaxID=4874 RepID=A0ABN7U8F9_GIGMA|nr:37449_t:CDS:2 [Gigaspora margarita]
MLAHKHLAPKPLVNNPLSSEPLTPVISYSFNEFNKQFFVTTMAVFNIRMSLYYDWDFDAQKVNEIEHMRKVTNIYGVFEAF